MARKTKKKVHRGWDADRFEADLLEFTRTFDLDDFRAVKTFLQGCQELTEGDIDSIMHGGGVHTRANLMLLTEADLWYLQPIQARLLMTHIEKEKVQNHIVKETLSHNSVHPEAFVESYEADMKLYAVAVAESYKEFITVEHQGVQLTDEKASSPKVDAAAFVESYEADMKLYAVDVAESYKSQEKKWHTEDLQSLLHKLTPEDVAAMSQRGYDPEWGRQVMYLKLFLLEFTMWEEDDIRVFICTEECMAVDELLRLFESPWRQRWAAPWIDEATAFQYAHQYVQLSRSTESAAK